MNCGNCLVSSVELIELGADMRCPRCSADYRDYRRSLPTLTPQQRYNANTRKLRPTGAAQRDRLVAARLALRSTT